MHGSCYYYISHHPQHLPSSGSTNSSGVATVGSRWLNQINRIYIFAIRYPLSLYGVQHTIGKTSTDRKWTKVHKKGTRLLETGFKSHSINLGVNIRSDVNAAGEHSPLWQKPLRHHPILLPEARSLSRLFTVALIFHCSFYCRAPTDCY